ncbi:MAG TPA: RecX family transcriptional regulator [Flavihumibacter sp.]|nr:RecX family transcriptional regulator [Flavihumibacter sp.]HQD10663.1 RecX family transcriptional regulator [Flavihumibacter sp.]
MASPRTYTPAQALQKARHYCAYQERCHQELVEKLFSYGLNKTEVDHCIATLIEENYLNEERFAIQFAGGKSRMKGWGQQRIRQELKQRQVSEYCIKKALAQFDADDYQQQLQKLAEKKWESLSAYPRLQREKKTRDFLLYKGYTWTEIQPIIKDLFTGADGNG